MKLFNNSATITYIAISVQVVIHLLQMNGYLSKYDQGSILTGSLIYMTHVMNVVTKNIAQYNTINANVFILL